ncbi:MAG: spermidine/putrescine ABC transporter substrate-binding protein [Oscillospiraceae bacterium]|jgi:spermidine/putrescine transport system substrate-binding protein|nr:spermidine/putrescine ABC transporter substrate-binding protein [Oscillospiraceae bacterium]
MKKIIGILLALTLSLALASCAAKEANPQTTAQEVNVYNWGEYIDEIIFDDFEAETGITVNYTTFQSNEEMYAAMKLGGTDYDVIIPSDYMVERLIDEDMLEKLDFANIPNLSLIDDSVSISAYDPTGEFSVPYMWGTVGIIYNSAEITDEITSWSSLFNSDYAGQIIMFNNPRDAFGVAVKYLGYSLNTTDETQIRAAYDLLIEQKPLVQSYDMDTIYDKLEGGSALIGVYYAGDYISMKENNPDLKFVLPTEGSNVFTDVMCIPKGATNKANGEAFINFMTSTDIAVRNMEMTGYVSPNGAAAEIYGDGLDVEDYVIQFPSQDALSRCEPFLNLPQATLDLYSQLWSDLKK